MYLQYSIVNLIMLIFCTLSLEPTTHMIDDCHKFTAEVT